MISDSQGASPLNPLVELRSLTINIKMSQELLIHKVHQFGKEAAEMRQLAQRMRELFPERLRKLQRESSNLTGAPRDRACLVDPRYLEAVQELVDLRARATYLRMQYDSHLMLYQARQSLKKS
jgi:CRP-like cAMP-binding protein